MSKMAELDQVIKDLRGAGSLLNDTADWLYQQFSSEEPARPDPKPEIKLEDVRAVLVDLSRSGYTSEVRALLQKYGAEKLSRIDPANYEGLLKDAKEIGHDG